MNPSIKRAVHRIPNDAWQHISYPTAVPGPGTGELISDAEVAKLPEYTALNGRKKADRVTARLIVRRVRDLGKPPVLGEQGELFPVWRYHPFFTDQPAPTLQAPHDASLCAYRTTGPDAKPGHTFRHRPRPTRGTRKHLPTPPTRAQPEPNLWKSWGSPADSRCLHTATRPKRTQKQIRSPPSSHLRESRLSQLHNAPSNLYLFRTCGASTKSLASSRHTQLNTVAAEPR